MQTKFEPRTGVSWNGPGNRTLYGIVIGGEEDGTVNIVQVDSLTPGIHCYDEGLNYERDHDNVRLDDAPPPFAFLCIWDGTDKCYAIAQTSVPIPFYPDELDLLTVTDGGEKISEKDFDTVFNHPWPEQSQKEFVPEYRQPEVVPEPDNKRHRQAMAAFSSLMAAVSEPDEEPEKDAGPDFW